LAAVNNGEPVKKCRGFDCRAKGPKTLSCFSKNKTSKDGHCRYCKSCERKRVSAWKKAKRKARAAAMAVN
jgi:7-cyano-7-deazaguanine synthase in queuosine biosynthesis